MTQEEAIMWLEQIKEKYIHDGDEAFDNKRREALDMAIQALEQEPCEDAISRQAVHKEILVLWNSGGDKDYCMESLRDFVAELPPVKPQEPKTEKVIKMRDATPEERESVDAYIKSISKPTGIEFDEEPSGDLISREAVLENAFRIYTHECGLVDVVGVATIENLPSVKPQERTGHWIEVQESIGIYRYKCDQCGAYHRAMYDYCPSCGAKMESEDKE